MITSMPSAWQNLLADTITADWYQELTLQVSQEYQKYTIYPPQEHIFAALEACRPETVKVVILGQDPYHGYGQAQGLAFSVNKSMPYPPSLKNIYKEIASDIGTPSNTDGDLTPWAEQGVLLLNSTLTVRARAAHSHATLGWNRLTGVLLEKLNDSHNHIVYMLWGNFAQKKVVHINTEQNCVLTAAHPSPLSAYRGFLGCKHFSKANIYLKKQGRTAITW